MMTLVPEALRLVYLVGPVTPTRGVALHALLAAAATLRASGLRVLAPHEYDADLGLAEAAQRRVDDILRADGLVVLPGSEGSPQADTEVALARALGKPVVLIDDLARVLPGVA